MTYTSANDNTWIWDILNNTLLSTSLIMGIGTFAVGVILQFSTGVAYIAFNFFLGITVAWCLLSVAVVMNRNATLTLILVSGACPLAFNSTTHLFFETTSISQPESVQFSVVGGLLSDTYYLHLPELVEVDKKATQIQKPYIIHTRTSGIDFKKVFICTTDKINSKCGKQI